MLIPVDTKRFEPVLTGKYAPSYKWEEIDGKKTRTNVQDKNSEGLPLWEVEFLVHEEYFGKEVTSVERVTVASAIEPNIKRYSVAEFENLSVSFYLGRGGVISKRWVAEGIVENDGEFFS